MNLFQQNITNACFSPCSYLDHEYSNESIQPMYIKTRLQKWVEFFNEHNPQGMVFIKSTMEALNYVVRKNRIFQTQTEFELQLSFSFYLKFFEARKNFIVANEFAAKKLLVLSLIYSKVFDFFKGSIRKEIQSLDVLVSGFEVDQLFSSLLVKYENPTFIISHFELLSPSELELLLFALSGKNMKKHEIFKSKLTSANFSQLMCYPFVEHYRDFVFQRAAIFVLMENKGLNRNFTIAFVRASQIFSWNPICYLDHISFWQKGLVLTSQASEMEGFNLTDVVDYLNFNYLELNEKKSLTRYSPQSLLRQARTWHHEVSTIDHNILRKLKWKRNKSLADLYFGIQQGTYRCLQLFNGEQLYKEGKALHHCVVTYAMSCMKKKCRIWSLQCKGRKNFQRWITIEEVNGTIVQARTFNNYLPQEDELMVIRDWANRMSFKIKLEKNQ